jgi:hypothetical protein
VALGNLIGSRLRPNAECGRGLLSSTADAAWTGFSRLLSHDFMN